MTQNITLTDVTMTQSVGLKSTMPSSAPNGKLLIARTPDGPTELWVGTGTGVEQISGQNAHGYEIGDSVFRLIPSNDSGKHLYDGALIQGSGSLKDFVDYIADLYSEEEAVWQQPVLTSNTSFGVVSSTSITSPHQPYCAFDGIKTGEDKYLSNGTSGGDITWQLPYKVKISSCKVYTTTESSVLARFPQSITLKASNDGSTWTIVGSASSYSQPASGEYVTVTVGAPAFYKYYKWEFGQSFGGDGGVAVSEIEITATYIETPSFFTTEEQWQASIAQYGVCGKFVYDSVNSTVRLPKITGIVEGTIDVNALGDLINARIPNIKGIISLQNQSFGDPVFSGCFSSVSWNRTNNSGDGGTGSGLRVVDFDASRSSNVYQDGVNDVKPQTICGYYYIVVANTINTQVEIDINNVMTDLNGKSDVDLSNTNNTAKILMSGMGMPSDTYIDLTLGASESQYTAPANGWFALSKSSAESTRYIKMINMSNGMTIQTDAYTSQDASFFIPALKSDVIQVDYNFTGATYFFRFIYAVGSESEAN